VGATLQVTDSTISGNAALGDGEGGAIYNGASGGGALDLFGTTIVGNEAADGGGLRQVQSGTTSLANTIVAENEPNDCAAGETPVTSLAANLDGDGSCIGAGPGDLPATDPELEALADNGGFTETHLPLVGSPVINTGSDALCTFTDQRGVVRPIGAHCEEHLSLTNLLSLLLHP
jgi:hypothetical protein